MKILLTGGSSFTGYWMAKELASAGHDVVVPFRRHPSEYPDELRRTRVEALAHVCRPVFGVSFGDDGFVELIKQGHWDLFCHHGAETADYKDPQFNVTAAVAGNTHRLPLVLDLLTHRGCDKLVLTGSVFENDEGAGSEDLRAFSPYGLSKSFTWQLFRYYARTHSIKLGKFVIANPFGPYEERRFTHYLMRCWSEGVPATVNTPEYVRDNIHVSLLAKEYARFATALGNGISRINPSGYVDTQGAFTQRIASQMQKRLKWKCEFLLKDQVDFLEPRVRINTDFPDVKRLQWNEAKAWDALAAYYETLFTAK